MLYITGDTHGDFYRFCHLGLNDGDNLKNKSKFILVENLKKGRLPLTPKLS